MSKNLTLHEANGKDVHLWQTPSFITDMCLSVNQAGIFDGGMEGVRRRYIIWVNSHQNGMWESGEDLEHMRERIKEHTKLVMSVTYPEFSWI